MKERAERLEEIVTTDHTQQLPPGTASGMAIGAEIAPPHPAPIGTVRVRAEMVGGVDYTTAPARHDEAWGAERRELAGGERWRAHRRRSVAW